MQQFEGTIPPELIESIKNNKCVLFVGAGLSAKITRSDQKKLPLWGEFLTELLEWSRGRNAMFWNGADEIKDIISKGNYLLAAQELQECITLGEFSDFLNFVFRDKDVKPSDTHTDIFKIPFRCLLTTNYDTLLEGAFALTHGGQVPVKFVQEDLTTISSPLRKEDFFIFKIHGDIERPASIVLGSRSYNQLLFRTPEYLHFLETLFTTHTVLFVGFSGSDVDLDFIIDRLSTIYARTLNKHYILLPENKYNLTEKRRLLLDRRLEVIEYKKDDEHTQVDIFFRQLDELINNTSPKTKPVKIINKKKDILILSSSIFHRHHEDIVLTAVSKAIPDAESKVWFFGFSDKKFDEVYVTNLLKEHTIALIFFDKHFLETKEVERLFEFITLREIEKKAVIIPIATESIDVPLFIRRRTIYIVSDINSEHLSEIIARSISSLPAKER
jgi:hypothetical protein